MGRTQDLVSTDSAPASGATEAEVRAGIRAEAVIHVPLTRTKIAVFKTLTTFAHMI